MTTTRTCSPAWLAVIATALATSIAIAAGCGGGGSGPAPIQGTKRDELCGAVDRPPAFSCPSGTRRMGKAPPDGTEMWCQRWDGTRHGSYRRFLPGSPAGAVEPDFVSEGVVVGAYREGEQDGAWWSRQPGADSVNVAFYDNGKLVQRVKCRR
jgi:hypothetical protein